MARRRDDRSSTAWTDSGCPPKVFCRLFHGRSNYHEHHRRLECRTAPKESILLFALDLSFIADRGSSSAVGNCYPGTMILLTVRIAMSTVCRGAMLGRPVTITVAGTHDSVRGNRRYSSADIPCV